MFSSVVASMAISRARAKGRATSGSFTSLPHSVFRAHGDRGPPVSVLSSTARALLVDICQQLNGRNNGDLSAAPKVLDPYGWRSRGTIDAALVELVAHGFLVQTRQGGRNRCSLFAVTWRGIDEGPHDMKPDPVPSRLWHDDKVDQRDATFRRRWQAIVERRRGKNASRYSDKASRYADKPAQAEAVSAP